MIYAAPSEILNSFFWYITNITEAIFRFARFEFSPKIISKFSSILFFKLFEKTNIGFKSVFFNISIFSADIIPYVFFVFR